MGGREGEKRTFHQSVEGRDSEEDRQARGEVLSGTPSDYADMSHASGLKPENKYTALP